MPARSKGSTDPQPPGEEAADFSPLRLIAAPMFLVTGVEATLEALSSPEEGEEAPSYAATWAPVLLGTAAALVQVARLTRRSTRVEAAARVLNSAVLGAGALGVAGMLREAAEGEIPATPGPLLLAAAGALGLLLDRREEEAERERVRRERWRQTARGVMRRGDRVERLVIRA